MTWRAGATGWHWYETPAGCGVGAVKMVGQRYRCFLVDRAGAPTAIPGNPDTLAKAKAAVEKAAAAKEKR
jgi:hypothetical protein